MHQIGAYLIRKNFSSRLRRYESILRIKDIAMKQNQLFKPRNLFEMMEKPFNREAFVAGTKLARTQRQQRVGHIERILRN